jgi:hypothetical protein
METFNLQLTKEEAVILRVLVNGAYFTNSIQKGNAHLGVLVKKLQALPVGHALAE